MLARDVDAASHRDPQPERPGVVREAFFEALDAAAVAGTTVGGADLHRADDAIGTSANFRARREQLTA